MSVRQRQAKQARPLVDIRHEHDACGVGFVAKIDGTRTYDIVDKGLLTLEALEHRGACGCDALTGDGAGVLTHLPHDLFSAACGELRIPLPAPGSYGVGMVFLPTGAEDGRRARGLLERAIREAGLKTLGWRDVPVDDSHCGQVALAVKPHIAQVFVGQRVPGRPDEAALERRLYLARKIAERNAREAGGAIAQHFYVCSLSARTIVYKGMLISSQLRGFFPDLADPRFTSAIALVHSRFSTNTLPTWRLAHPFRYLAHNGEINTVRGNINWMNARERLFESPLFGDDIKKLLPIIEDGQSDSAVFDNAVELLYQTGRDLPHVVSMMIPEAWEKHESMPQEKKDFYAYHACLMEPWDGPASIAFSDGRGIGAILDRNGLRPSRYLVTKDGLVVMASETGVLDIPASEVVLKERLRPGRMFYVDLEEQRIVEDGEIKHELATRAPYGEWLRNHQTTLAGLPKPKNAAAPVVGADLMARQQMFGYTLEDLRMLLTPMALNGQEPVGSMGTDTPLACLSDKPQLLFSYFKQLFAQVTNPPIDSIREDLVMSLELAVGKQKNIFEEMPDHARLLAIDQPILSNEQLAKIRELSTDGWRSRTISCVYPTGSGGEGLDRALDRICAEATAAVAQGVEIIILSDREAGADMTPVPSLLFTGAVHHHLIRTGVRTKVGIVLETGEPREVMHFCLLLGYGASAINPYLALDTLADLAGSGDLHGHDAAEATANFVKAVGKGILKTMSKMGISTLGSYRGAQIFEAIGLSQALVDRCFTWTASRIEGIGLDVVARESEMRHRRAYRPEVPDDHGLEPGGQYAWRRRGEFHLFNPQTIAKLQHSVRSGDYGIFKKYAKLVDEQERNLCTLRSLLDFDAEGVTPVPLDQVEPAREIVKRFKTGAMSFGSISKEAHENLAIAMNRIGGKSNTGEGGEDPARFVPDANGDSRRSAIKQVASGRFGVTINYLVNADELQIKIAQGAKPGEGGQLPGHKVDAVIAKTRYSTPGVGLISPPPHHDIYSIEDLAQLIHDLKNSNPRARISVKLVAEVGVGTVAAGVAKAKADVVLISGHDGGTGASPLSSIKHAGIPWELGLAETQQVLVQNDLRSRIRVETDGQLKTGRDVAIAALLGADEFGFATGALVASGCIMMRKCHLNTCPVGIATQDAELRKRFEGQPEHVINFMFFVAEQLREIMAALGFRTVQEMVGRSDRLRVRPTSHWKAKTLDLAQILYRPEVGSEVGISGTGTQDHGLDKALDHQLIELARPALEQRKAVKIELPIRNINRTVCTMLSSEVTRRYGDEGLPPYTIGIEFTGSAGQSFCAFLARGIAVKLVGDANDYFCKGISAGQVVVLPPADAGFVAEDNIVIGNVALYGATGGEVFARGRGGERFCVRNSGASAVIEGVGDHACEYMTGGTVVVLGPQGRNFAAGMSGGVAYVLDEDGTFSTRCNLGMVELLPLTDEADSKKLHQLVQRHHQYTGSAVAERLLEHWDGALRRFVKVMPTEYRKVLEKMHLDSEALKLAAV